MKIIIKDKELGVIGEGELDEANGEIIVDSNIILSTAAAIRREKWPSKLYTHRNLFNIPRPISPVYCECGCDYVVVDYNMSFPWPDEPFPASGYHFSCPECSKKRYATEEDIEKFRNRERVIL